METIAVFLVVA